jgi:hypothetical protein
MLYLLQNQGGRMKWSARTNREDEIYARIGFRAFSTDCRLRQERRFAQRCFKAASGFCRYS